MIFPKSVMIGALYYFTVNRKPKNALEIPYHDKHKALMEATKTVLERKGWNPLSRWFVQKAVNLVCFWFKEDEAYNSAFFEIDDEYNRLKKKRRL